MNIPIENYFRDFKRIIYSKKIRTAVLLFKFEKYAFFDQIFLLTLH